LQKKVRVAVVGASGYTGGELLRLLIGHPLISITSVVSSPKSSGRSVSSLFPHLAGFLPLSCEPLDPPTISAQADLIFLALPHTTSLEPVAQFLSLNKPVIDLSADYRLKDPDTYQHWYQCSHPYPNLLHNAVYGLPELYRQHIQQARLVAAPGCYSTAAILQLAPLVATDLLEPDSIIIDAKSGVSGAGRNPSPSCHFPEAHDAIHAYQIGKHRHLPEIEQTLQSLSDSDKIPNNYQYHLGAISFTPHLVPMNRGILSTAYAKVRTRPSEGDWYSIYQQFYKDEPFIRVSPSPETVNPCNIRGSNFCDMAVTFDDRTGWLISVAALDNLVKGAAGQAIQSMNLMLGFSEEMGLTAPGFFP
jgi:N-acetyl-gamma-glutamyl-phosphate reductase